MNSTDFLMSLLEDGRTAGMIQSTEAAIIPELVEFCERTCQYIIGEMTAFYEDDVSKTSFVNTSLAWCAFAGIGAVCQWNEDWPSLKKTGVYNALTEPRGLEEMDEYVLDIIGLSKDKEECDKFMSFLHDESAKGVVTISKSQNVFPTFVEYAKAMYLFGCVFEMNRLGMY